MKKIIFLFAAVLMTTAFANAQEIKFVNYKAGEYKQVEGDEEKAGAALIQKGEDATAWNFGDVKHKSTGYRYFKFTNTGKAPLIIADAKGSCGCTVPTWPREPIMPGKSGFIKVKYDTQRVGAFTKTVTLTTNAVTTPNVTLTISGNIGAEEGHTDDHAH